MRTPVLFPVMMLVQRLERRKGFEFGAAGALKLAERGAALARVIALSKASIQRLEHRPFQRRHRAVIDQVASRARAIASAGAAPRSPGPPRNPGTAGGVDVEIVETNAARRRIWADMARLGEQRVQWVESSRRAACGRRLAPATRQIAKSPMPQLRALRTPKLDRQSPAARPSLQSGRQMAIPRRDDQMSAALSPPAATSSRR